jgi:AraC family transcriptional regulator of adaptative response/methylated-DNA-[protein]-cysteine methyltransferase
MDTLQPLPSVDEMQRAYLASDASYDGIFLLAVRTTGIFCRPSCRARKPQPENVEYFGTTREALFAGYRPCKRCRPLDTNGRPPEWVRRLLAEIEQSPDLRIGDSELRRRGIEPARARRFFQQNFGMTFQAYCRARRLGDAFVQIKQGRSIDAAAYDVGFESPSGFRDAFVRQFGKPPGSSRNGDCLRIAWLETPIGPMIASASARGICLLEFSDRRMLEAQIQTLRRRFQAAIVPGEHEHLERLRSELREYFDGERQEFSVPLEYPGSAFQVRVWEALRTIPSGTTWSYERLAGEIGSPGSSRAVGRANGLNRIAIVIPCHRVVNKNGELSGYGGGVWRKRYLLGLEQAAYAEPVRATMRLTSAAARREKSSRC